MALNFPISPSLGDTYSANGTFWQFDGTAWNIISNNPTQLQILTNIDNVTNSPDTTPNLFLKSVGDGTTVGTGTYQFDTVNVTTQLAELTDVDVTTNTPTTTSGLVLTSDGDSSYSFQTPVVTTQLAQLTDVDVTTNIPTTTSGLVLTSDGDSSYSFQTPLGDNQKEFIATGAISAGEVVGLRNDGTVEVFQINTSYVENSYTSSLTASYYTPRSFDSAYDSVNNRLFIATVNAAPEIYIKIGTISNGVITFGSVIMTGLFTYSNQGEAWYKIVYDETTDQLVLVSNWQDAVNFKMDCYVGSVSGNSISWSTPSSSSSSYPFHITSLISIPDRSQVLINWVEWNTGSYQAFAVVANLGANTIATQTVKTLTAGPVSTPIVYSKSIYIPTVSWADWQPNPSVVIIYNEWTGSNQRFYYSMVAVLSNGDMPNKAYYNFDTGGDFLTNEFTEFDICYDGLSQKIVAVTRIYNTGTSQYDTEIYTSALPTSQTGAFNIDLTIANSNRTHYNLFYDTNDNLLKFAYSDRSTKIIYFSTYSVDTKTESDITALTQTLNLKGLDVNIINNDYVFTHNGLGTGTNEIGSTVYANNTSNGDSWIGIAAEDIADGATGKIDLPGAINRSQTGLTANLIYYVASDGSLTTTATQYGKIGRAYSPTELQIFESYKQLNFASQLIFGN